MKTLAESLFDKDLVEKNVVFGDFYEVRNVIIVDSDYQNKGSSYYSKEDEYKWVLNTLKMPALRHDVKTPVHISNFAELDFDTQYYGGWKASDQICDLVGYLVAVINALPIDTKKEYPNFGIAADVLVDGVKPYLKNVSRGKNSWNSVNSYYMQVNKKGVLSFVICRGNYDFNRTLTIIFDKKK